MDPQVSIITPVYNGEKFISKTIGSVLSQTFSSWEMILIDDGSTDHTCSVVQDYSARDPRIKLVRLSRNSGGRPAVARNAGLKRAKGTYIAFLDADDLYYPEKLSRVIEVFEIHPEIDLVCHGVKFQKESKIIKTVYCGHRLTHKHLLFFGNSLITSAVVLKRSCLIENGFFSERSDYARVDDYDMWLRLSRSCRISCLHQVLGEYIMRKQSASSDIDRQCKDVLKLLDDYFTRWHKKSFYYRFLMNFRIASCLRDHGRAFIIRKNDLESARSYFRRALAKNPLDWKNWASMILLWISR